IDVAGVTAGTMLGVDQVNKIVDCGRLTPALVSPVATTIRKHTGKVANGSYARSGERCASVSVSPGGAAIGGCEDEVGDVMRKTATAFIHTCDIHSPAARQVARDLHVTNKCSAVDHCCRATPCGAAIIGVDAHESALADVKVVPGNVQTPKKRRSWIVVGPTRLAISRALVESAEMGPAIRVFRCRRLIPAQALAAAGAIQPHCNPGPRWLVVQNNRIAKRIVKGALTVGFGKAGEGSAAVGRDRCAGDVDRSKVAASRVIVGHDYLERIIRVRRGKRLRLSHI